MKAAELTERDATILVAVFYVGIALGAFLQHRAQERRELRRRLSFLENGAAQVIDLRRRPPN